MAATLVRESLISQLTGENPGGGRRLPETRTNAAEHAEARDARSRVRERLLPCAVSLHLDGVPGHGWLARYEGHATGSPAHLCGVKARDVIRSFCGTLVQESAHVVYLVASRAPGSEVTLELERNAVLVTVSSILAARPAESRERSGLNGETSTTTLP